MNNKFAIAGICLFLALAGSAGAIGERGGWLTYNVMLNSTETHSWFIVNDGNAPVDFFIVPLRFDFDNGNVPLLNFTTQNGTVMHRDQIFTIPANSTFVVLVKAYMPLNAPINGEWSGRSGAYPHPDNKTVALGGSTLNFATAKQIDIISRQSTTTTSTSTSTTSTSTIYIGSNTVQNTTPKTNIPIIPIIAIAVSLVIAGIIIVNGYNNYKKNTEEQEQK